MPSDHDNLKLHTAEIAFPSKAWKRVRQRALDQGISASELVRRAVLRYLQEPGDATASSTTRASDTRHG